MIYKCIRKCQYDQHIFRVEEKLDFPGKPKPCPECLGKGCAKCRNTGRIDPPHHFMPAVAVSVEEKEAEEVAETSEIDAIRAEMDAMGKSYDKRWKLPRMKDALIQAKKETGN
jgi:hypothetical protein